MKRILLLSIFGLISFQISLGQNNDLMDRRIVMPDNSHTIQLDAVTPYDSRLQDSLKSDFSRSNINSGATAPFCLTDNIFVIPPASLISIFTIPQKKLSFLLLAVTTTYKVTSRILPQTG